MSSSDLLSLFADLLSFCAVVFSVVFAVRGLSLTRHQIEQNNKQLELSYEIQKATFFKELYLMMFGDPDMRKASYLVDYDRFTFDKSSFPGSQEEELIDKLLNYADLICALHLGKMLTQQEMSFFEYELTVIYTNPGIQAYLEFLKDAYRREKVVKTPFSSFVTYCEKVLSNRAITSSE